MNTIPNERLERLREWAERGGIYDAIHFDPRIDLRALLADYDALRSEIGKLREPVPASVEGDSAWVLDMLEGLCVRAWRDAEWELEMDVGEDGDTINVRGPTLTRALLAYFVSLVPAPDDRDGSELEATRSRLRNLIARQSEQSERKVAAFLARVKERR